jgi:uncharacterized protein (DUF4415 family)
MAKKQSESSAQGRRREKSVKHIPDSGIDFSDIPELSDKELSRGRRVGRPKSDVVKQMIALRIDPALLSKLKKLTKKRKTPYQTLLHELLEEAVRDAA